MKLHMRVNYLLIIFFMGMRFQDMNRCHSHLVFILFMTIDSSSVIATAVSRISYINCRIYVQMLVTYTRRTSVDGQ